jgi:PE-PPE domain/PE family
MLAAAATDVAEIGSAISTVNAAAAGPTTGVLAAAEDEVSAAVEAVFNTHAQAYQTISAEASAFHEQFAQALAAAGSAYAQAEAANVAAVSNALGIVNGSIQTIRAEAEAFPRQFAALMTAGSASYASAEAAGVSLLQGLGSGLSSLTELPKEVKSAALGGLGSAITEATALARTATTAILPAAADKIATAVTASFDTHGHGQIYQNTAAAGAALHQQITQAQSSASSAYQGKEIGHEQSLVGRVAALEQPLLPLFTQLEGGPPTIPTVTVPSNQTSALILGGSAYPLLNPQLVSVVVQMYINPVFPGASSQPLFTPEQFWPATPQLGDLTFGQSVSQGVTALNAAINIQAAAGKSTVVFGISQSATVSTVEIDNLIAAGSPFPHQLSFVLTGDPNNPNGGILERFAGAYIPSLNVQFIGATPPNAPYAIQIYTAQYDGVADFPQYILNPVADVNALAGFVFVHGLGYAQPGFVANALPLPTSPGYTGSTQYFITLTQDLPLVDPVRDFLPAPYGTALADFLQPDLRVWSDLGYGSGEFPNDPTTASLIEAPDPFTIVPDLVRGAVQGPQAALVDLGVLPESYYPIGQYPFSPELDPDLNFPLPQPLVTLPSVT